jgi:hypothetical protein
MISNDDINDDNRKKHEKHGVRLPFLSAHRSHQDKDDRASLQMRNNYQETFDRLKQARADDA